MSDKDLNQLFGDLARTSVRDDIIERVLDAVLGKDNAAATAEVAGVVRTVMDSLIFKAGIIPVSEFEHHRLHRAMLAAYVAGKVAGARSLGER